MWYKFLIAAKLYAIVRKITVVCFCVLVAHCYKPILVSLATEITLD